MDHGPENEYPLSGSPESGSVAASGFEEGDLDECDFDVIDMLVEVRPALCKAFFFALSCFAMTHNPTRLHFHTGCNIRGL